MQLTAGTEQVSAALFVTWAEGPSDMYPQGFNGEQECYSMAGLAELLRNLKAKPEVTCIDLFTAAGHVSRAERAPGGEW